MSLRSDATDAVNRLLPGLHVAAALAVVGVLVLILVGARPHVPTFFATCGATVALSGATLYRRWARERSRRESVV